MKYLSVLTAIITFCIMLGTSCSKDTNNYYDNEDGRTAIRLSSNVELSALRLQDMQIVQGRRLSFFVTPANNLASILYDNEEIIANGEGGFTYEETMYYPTNGNNVDFYALHPYSEAASMEEPVAFTVAADQSEQAGYLNSDVLYAFRKNVARTNSAVTMNFYHRMAQLNFVIVQGEGADISDLRAVTTLNALPATTVDLTDGSLGDATGDPIEIIPYGIATRNTSVQGEASGITAIVVPQTISAGATFRITLGNIDYYYTSTGEGLTFEAGKKYTLRLTIRQATIDLQSTVEDWVDGGTITGDGTIE